MGYDVHSMSWRLAGSPVLVLRYEAGDEDPWTVIHMGEPVTWGQDAASVLRDAADDAPGRYREALLAAAADPPSVPNADRPRLRPYAVVPQRMPIGQWCGARVMAATPEAALEMVGELRGIDVAGERWRVVDLVEADVECVLGESWVDGPQYEHGSTTAKINTGPG